MALVAADKARHESMVLGWVLLDLRCVTDMEPLSAYRYDFFMIISVMGFFLVVWDSHIQIYFGSSDWVSTLAALGI